MLHSKKRTGDKFIKEYESVLNAFTNTINELILGDKCNDTEKLLEYVLKLLGKKRCGETSFKLMHEVYNLDYDTFVHSLNVALISHEIAVWAGLPKEEQELATMCGLLHDIGKLQIDSAILKKPGLLTAEERACIQEHPIRGFELLLKSPTSDVHVRNAVLMHHERWDGSGYPYGLKGEQIDKYARIVAIADVYDAMTADRVYRAAIDPQKVLQKMSRDSSVYDSFFFRIFLQHVSEIMAA